MPSHTVFSEPPSRLEEGGGLNGQLVRNVADGCNTTRNLFVVLRQAEDLLVLYRQAS